MNRFYFRVLFFKQKITQTFHLIDYILKYRTFFYYYPLNLRNNNFPNYLQWRKQQRVTCVQCIHPVCKEKCLLLRNYLKLEQFQEHTYTSSLPKHISVNFVSLEFQHIFSKLSPASDEDMNVRRQVKTDKRRN